MFLHPHGTHLVQFIGTLAAEVVQTGQNHDWFRKHVHADGTDELFLQRPHRGFFVVRAYIQWKRHCRVPLLTPQSLETMLGERNHS